MSRSNRRSALALALILALGLGVAAPGRSASDRTRGATEIVPRGTIAAIVEPSFVSANEAKLPDDAWVLAVAIEGDSRAYDLNLLNRHEVVNDVVGGMPIAAVWCPLAMAGIVYDREYDDGLLTFEATEPLAEAPLVMRDRETGSTWSVMAGAAIEGKMAGEALHETAFGFKTTWGEWRVKHPDTRVLSVGGRTHEAENVYADYLGSGKTFGDVATPDNRLPAKTPVFAFRWEGEPYAVSHDRLNGGMLWHPEGEGDGKPAILIHRDSDSPTGVSTSAAILPTEIKESDDPEGLALKLDDRLEAGTPGVSRLPGFDTWWYTWSAQNPGTILID
ncbi:MAG: DUF3179 domain-containing (seleno)protein [bacterium]